MANKDVEIKKDNKEIDPIVHSDPTQRVVVDGKVVDRDGHPITDKDANDELTKWVNGLEDHAVLLEINRLVQREGFGNIKRVGDGTDKDDNRKYLLELKKEELRK